MAAYLDTPSAIQRRRAFLAALMPIVGREAALEAIDLWENAFGSEQPLWRGVSQFSTLVIRELNWKIKPEDLALRLVEYLQLAEHALPPDPGAPRLGLLNGVESLPVQVAPTPAPTPARAAPTEPEAVALAATPARISTAAGAAPSRPAVVADSNASPSSRTLCALLICMRDAARDRDAHLEEQVIGSFVQAAEAQLPGDIAHDLQALVSGARLTLAHEYSISRAVAVVNLFYVALAHAHGPIAADRLLTASVRAVEQMPQARDCAPRELL